MVYDRGVAHYPKEAQRSLVYLSTKYEVSA